MLFHSGLSAESQFTLFFYGQMFQQLSTDRFWVWGCSLIFTQNLLTVPIPVGCRGIT